MLIHLQPLFLVLIVLVLARSNDNWKRLLKQISKLAGTWVALQLIGVFMGIESLRVECGGYLAIHPQVYPPNSNLIWFLYTHVPLQAKLDVRAVPIPFLNVPIVGAGILNLSIIPNRKLSS